jgi:hypothetical protein
MYPNDNTANPTFRIKLRHAKRYFILLHQLETAHVVSYVFERQQNDLLPEWYSTVVKNALNSVPKNCTFTT